ncbi:MAG: FAD-dependent oxidoreductase [Myxococcota bacterium]
MVLIGAGHASLQVITDWQDRDVELTLISDRRVAYYSGMVPGWLAGEYALDDLSIDLERLTARSRARLICGAALRVDPNERSIETAGGQRHSYRVALIDTGSQTSIPGVTNTHDRAANTVPARPIGALIDHFENTPLCAGERVTVVGAGAGGVELAFACTARGAAVTLIDAVGLMAGASAALIRQVRRQCEALGTVVELGSGVAAVDADRVMLENGATVDFDRLIWATGAEPTALLRASPLPCDERGFIPVRPTLQVAGFDDLLVAGDAASWMAGPALSKAGVYAVRAGPVAAHNLRAIVRDRSLREFRPQRDFLKLLNLGDGTAIASRFGLALRSRTMRSLKDRIDRRWLARFA